MSFPSRSRPSGLPFGVVLAAQAALVGLNLWAPAWRPVNLDREHNVPTWFHGALLLSVAVLALDILRLESRVLERAGGRRRWALAWLAVAAGFAYLALDETLVIHEGFLTDELRTWLTPASPLQLTLAWLLVFLPGIVVTVAFLLASLGARARLSPALLAWGGAGLALWVVALTLEGTTKSFFIPRNLYWLEVILEETAESLGTTGFAWAFASYRLRLRAWTAEAPPPAFAVPWRWVTVGTLALAAPAAVVGASIAWNPHALHRYLGDDHVRAGRLDDAVRAYRAALSVAPAYGRAWHRLGLAELRRGQYQAAEQALAAAVRLEPRSAGAANGLGVALSRLGRDAEAAAAFRRAVALDPDDADAVRNLGVVLRRLGHEAEAAAALARARTLRPARLAVTALRATMPAERPLAYVADARIEAALAHSRGGRVEAAAAAYRGLLVLHPRLAAAHLGLANELVRWGAASRLAAGAAATAAGGNRVRPRVTIVFSDWVRAADGRWEPMESAVAAPPPPVGSAELEREARAHYAEALALGAAGPARLGLAALAHERGDASEAARELGSARALDPSLPLASAVDPEPGER